jgi:hypothetical protein
MLHQLNYHKALILEIRAFYIPTRITHGLNTPVEIGVFQRAPSNLYNCLPEGQTLAKQIIFVVPKKWGITQNSEL